MPNNIAQPTAPAATNTTPNFCIFSSILQLEDEPANYNIAAQLQQWLTIERIATGDLLSVFAVICGLLQHAPQLLASQHLQASLKRLIICEKERGGPYLNNGHLDIAANLQIALFVRLVAKPLPKLNAFLHHALTTNYLQQHCQSAYLVHIANKIQPSRAHSSTANSYPQSGHLKHHMAVIASAKLLASQSGTLHAQLSRAIDSITAGDTHKEITLFAYLFNNSVHNPLPPNQVIQLGVANLYGWIGYTVYDAVMDGDSSHKQLPIAHAAIRLALRCFYQLPVQPLFTHTLHATITAMDQANSWELANCQFAANSQTLTFAHLPRYGKGAVLAQRSFAHALGPLYIATNNRVGSAALSGLKTALTHYLIARQIADDLYDWRDDIIKGRASYVVTAALRSLRVQPGTHDLPTLLVRMQQQLQGPLGARLHQRGLQHATTAGQAFIKNGSILTPTTIGQSLTRLEQALQKPIATAG